MALARAALASMESAGSSASSTAAARMSAGADVCETSDCIVTNNVGPAARRAAMWLLWQELEPGKFLCRVCQAAGRERVVAQTANATSNLRLHYKLTKQSGSGAKRSKLDSGLAFPECADAVERLETEAKALGGMSRISMDENLTHQLDDLVENILHAVADKVTAVRRQATMDRWSAKPVDDRRFQVSLELWMARHTIPENAIDDFAFDEVIRAARRCSGNPVQTRKTRTDVVVNYISSYLSEELDQLLTTMDGTAAVFSMTSDSWTSDATKRK